MFLERDGHLLLHEQVAAVSDSNTLALPISSVPNQKLLYGLDYKAVNGEIYLRIGLGIQNLDYHLYALVKYLDDTHLLE